MPQCIKGYNSELKMIKVWLNIILINNCTFLVCKFTLNNVKIFYEGIRGQKSNDFLTHFPILFCKLKIVSFFSSLTFLKNQELLNLTAFLYDLLKRVIYKMLIKSILNAHYSDWEMMNYLVAVISEIVWGEKLICKFTLQLEKYFPETPSTSPETAK